jgi:MYXO-CTERM domain-containing protein
VNRPLKIGLAVLLAAAATPGLAFVRSTTVSESPGKGLCLYWGTRAVTYKVNATSAATPPCQDAAAAVALTAASFPAWTPSCTDFRFANGGASVSTAVDGRDGVNLVVFRARYCPDVPCAGNACATQYNCWDHGMTSTIALTTVTFVASTGEIVDADMEVNGWNGATGGASGLPLGAYLTCATPTSPGCSRPPYGQSGCNYIDVGNIVTHEAGHMLGLDHTCGAYPVPADQTCGHTMDPTMLPGETSKRVLTADDKNGVCTIYPLGAATVTCVPAPEPAKSGGCSTGGGGTGAMGVLALGLLVWRRRKAG